MFLSLFSRAATGVISTNGDPSMVISMVLVVSAILFPARSVTAASRMTKIWALAAVSIWAALRVAQMVVPAAVLVAAWSRVTLPCCPEIVNPE